MSPIQDHRTLAVSTPLGDETFLVKRIEVEEALSDCFEIRVELLGNDAEVVFEDLIGGNVTLRIETPEETTRYLNGYVESFGFVGDEDTPTYEAVLRPWFWFLTRVSDCRIFQDTAIPDIVLGIFREHGFTDFENALTGTYSAVPYCVQYRETDFNFISRLLENEGIYYWFRHENGKHTMVLADSSATHEDCPGYARIPFRSVGDRVVQEETIWSWRPSKRVLSGHYTLHDFNYAEPNVNLLTRSSIAREHPGADFELFDYPGKYSAFGDGERYSRIRMEEVAAGHEYARGVTDAAGIAVGHCFELLEHPRADQNRKYVVTSTRIEIDAPEHGPSEASGSGAAHHRCELTAMDAQTAFRPPRRAEKPTMRGPQTAIVVGPEGEEIHTDELGRVKVKFHWDRYGEANETSSCWIRVAQPVAGKKWGMFALPRIGQEVVVDFLEGDPDCPIVVGGVYNGATTPPYPLPGSSTMSTTKTNSSKGGQGFNEIRFEDRKGEEQIFVHGEKNVDIRVKNDVYEWVGNKRHLVVKVDQLEKVENDRSETIGRDQVTKITRDHNLTVEGKQAVAITGSKSLKVSDDVIEIFEKNQSTQVTDDCYLKAKNIVIEATDNVTIKVGGSFIAIESGGIKIGTSGDVVLEASGAINGTASSNLALEASASASMKGSAGLDLESGGVTNLKGSMVNIN